MNIEEVRECALSLNGVTEDQPFGDDIVTFRIEGKIFLCLWLGVEEKGMQNVGEPRFAIKLSPERNEELRATHSGILLAYHWNKTHWSDVYYAMYDERCVKGWIAESYLLVVSKLPKRLRVKYTME